MMSAVVVPEYEDRGDGLLRVKPYDHEYRSWVKGRWVGRELLEVFKCEFQDRPASYYEKAMAEGMIEVDGRPATVGQVLKGKQMISHRIHRHEPPIPSQPIRIVHRDDDMLVVDKPSGIPAHPSGRYNHLSLTELLRHQLQLSHVSLINRLDRLTSGLVLVATNPHAAQRLHQQMEARDLAKTYLAEVCGEFPSEQPVECRKAIRVISHKLGLNGIVEEAEEERVNEEENARNEDEKGIKSAWTIFQRLSYDPVKNTSIVQAEPQTGRTHQIRLHLQYLGHPIINDPLYGPPEQRRNIEHDTVEQGDDDVLCSDCHRPKDDPSLDSLQLNLHAWKYSSPEWSYETTPPAWAAQRL